LAGQLIAIDLSLAREHLTAEPDKRPSGHGDPFRTGKLFACRASAHAPAGQGIGRPAGPAA